MRSEVRLVISRGTATFSNEGFHLERPLSHLARNEKASSVPQSPGPKQYSPGRSRTPGEQWRFTSRVSLFPYQIGAARKECGRKVKIGLPIAGGLPSVRAS